MQRRANSVGDDVVHLTLAHPLLRALRVSHPFDPSCPACSPTPGSFQHLAAHELRPDAPAPHPNPESGHVWYHGTAFEPERRDSGKEEGGELDPGKAVHDGEDAEARQPNGRGHKFFNTDLGTHFTSLHDVARIFSGAGDASDSSQAPTSRIAHASVHMANPKTYPSEHDMNKDAVEWAIDRRMFHRAVQPKEDGDPGYFPHAGIQHINQYRTTSGRSDPEDWQDWLRFHPRRDEIARGFEQHLKSKGHDGIVYGNEYEGPTGHACAIAFRDTPVTMHQWEWTHPSRRSAALVTRGISRETSLHGRQAGKGKPRHDSPDVARRAEPSPGDPEPELGQEARGDVDQGLAPGASGRPRYSLIEHPAVLDDVERLPKRNQDLYFDRVDALARGERHSSTHARTGPLTGWAATSLGGNQYRLVHRFVGDELHVLSAGNHDEAYDKAKRRMPYFAVQQPPEGLSFAYSEQQTGGSKWPTRHQIGAVWPGEEDRHAGVLNYFTSPTRRKILIENLHVPHHQRQGIGSALMDELQRRHPDASIDHGDRTDDGKAWWGGYSDGKTVRRGRTAAADEDDYRGQHEAPDPDYAAPLHDLRSMMGDDFYEHPEYHRHGTTGEDESIYHAMRVRGRPDAKVKIYRALPAEHAHRGIRPGDWVTTSREYALEHARQNDDPKHDWPVIRTSVRADELHTAGDITEYGYNGDRVHQGMVSSKGGYHQEVRQHADGVIRPVVRRQPRQASQLPRVLYKGVSQRALDAINQSGGLQPSKMGESGPGVYLTGDHEYAKRYAGMGYGGGAILHVEHSIENPLVRNLDDEDDPGERKYRHMQQMTPGGTINENGALGRALAEAGHDAVETTWRGRHEVAVHDPAKLRVVHVEHVDGEGNPKQASAGDWRYEHRPAPNGEVHWVNAYHPETGERVGDMTWKAHGDHRVTFVSVYDEENRRKGIATGMWNKAREVDPLVSHNTEPGGQTDAGHAWAQRTASTYTVRLEHGRRRAPHQYTVPEDGPVTPAYLQHPVDVSYVKVAVPAYDEQGQYRGDTIMENEARNTAVRMHHDRPGVPTDMVTKADVIQVEAAAKTSFGVRSRLATKLAMGQAGPDYQGLTFKYWKNYSSQHDEPHWLDGNDKHDSRSFFGMMAFRPGEQQSVGSLEFSPLHYGEGDREVHVHGIKVAPVHQRRGVGTALLRELERHYPDVPIHHGLRTQEGADLTERFYGRPSEQAARPGRSERYGDAPYEGGWTLGGKPWDPQTKQAATRSGWRQGDRSVCPCGTAVKYDASNGWQHLDGSISHDDGESVSDKMPYSDAPVTRFSQGIDPSPVRTRFTNDIGPDVRTRFRQSGLDLHQIRVLNPTTGHDPDLFDGEHLKPEVRTELLRRWTAFCAQHGLRDWSTWACLWFTGGEASEWSGPGSNPNGDFDMQVGIRHAEFAAANPIEGNADPIEISTRFNDLFWTDLNDHDFHPAGSPRVFDLTWYQNPAVSDDIRAINPYAAYDVVADTWAVHPEHYATAPKLPHGVRKALQGAERYARQILALPEPQRTREAAALFESWHTDRSAAFGPGGAGVFDYANLRMKALEATGVWQQLQDAANRLMGRTAAGLRQPVTNHRNKEIGHTVSFPGGVHHAFDEDGNKLGEFGSIPEANRAIRENDKKKPPSWAGVHPETGRLFEVSRPADARYLRFGRVPEGERSRNHLDGFKEDGVSVYDLHHGYPIDTGNGDSLHEFLGDWKAGKKKAFVVSGDQHGEGSDTEPVLRNVKVHGEWNPPRPANEYGEYFKTDDDVAEDPHGLGRVPDDHIGGLAPRTAARRDPHHGEGPWFHGTNADLKPGDQLLPGDTVGEKSHGRYSDGTKVWVSNDPWRASAYGHRTFLVEPHSRPRSPYANHDEHHTVGATVIAEVDHRGNALPPRTARGDFPDEPPEEQLGHVREAHPEEFAGHYQKMLQGNPFAYHLTHHTAEGIHEGQMKPLLARDGRVGVLIHDHGDGRVEATGLFNQSGVKSLGSAMLHHAIQHHGVNYVECFGPHLPKVYEKLGFKTHEQYPFDRELAHPHWNYERFGEPDYHLMHYRGTGKEAAMTRVDWSAMRWDDPEWVAAARAEIERDLLAEHGPEWMAANQRFLDENWQATLAQLGAL